MSHSQPSRFFYSKLSRAADKAVEECTQEDILARDVFDSVGRKLLSANTVMNDYLRLHLKRSGVSRISVCSFPEKKESSSVAGKDYRSAALCLKGVLLDVAAGRAPDFGRVRQISRVVSRYSDKRSSASILKMIHRIHSADHYTYSHSIHVAFYSMLLALWLGYSRKDSVLAFHSGLLHDIGKIRIDESVLKKPGALTAEEFEMMKEHTTLGFHLVDFADFDRQIKQAVLLHHERLNGSGYPFGVRPASRFARLVAITDVYDAMTTDRVYKKGVTPFKAFDFFLGEGLTQFDPHMLRVFIANMSAYLTGSRVVLAGGETATLVYIPPENPSAYILRGASGDIDDRQREIVALAKELC